MEPKALLYFIYRDTLLEDEELFMLHSSFFPSLSESFIAKLLAAGEKYGLPRLMLMCESILCKDISIDFVAYSFTLADRYCATHLKSYLKKNCPLLQLELLRIGVGCQKEFS
ncbi:BTB/POZ and MATH domain-containing protein 4 [Glycine max]|nr:BTB/POZ and MATH domain-containing protein 4 [Glycine max]